MYLIILFILSQVTYADELDRLYPKAKPRRKVYSCCVYDNRTSDIEFYCNDDDSECIDDYRSLMNKYYMATGVILMVMIACLVISCVTSCRKERIMKVKKVKKAPIKEQDKGKEADDDDESRDRKNTDENGDISL